MSGIPVVVVERFGLPVKAVEGRAPVMTVSPYGMGIPIVLSEWGAPFIVEGLVPPLNPPGPINDLSVLSTTTSTIALAFTDAARATSHEYQLDGGGWAPLDSSKVIDSLPPDTSFDVQVRGVNDDGDGPPSNTVQAQTQPIPAGWQSFTLTSGSNAFGWGYAIEPIVSAPFGAIDRQPYTGSTLLGFWEAPDDSRTIVAFAGDVVDELDGYTFEIDGVPLAILTPASYNSGSDMTIMYLESHWMVDDQEYVVERVPEVTGVQYGRTPDFDAGTDFDYIVDSSGAGDFTTIQAALTVAAAAGAGTIGVRDRGVPYDEFATLSGYSGDGIMLSGYGTETPTISGGITLTDWEDQGGGIYKTEIPRTDIIHNAYMCMLLQENGEPLDLVQRRRDESNLFIIDEYATYFNNIDDGCSYTVDGDGYFETISHPALLPTYSDAELEQMVVGVWCDPNLISFIKVASATDGVLTLESNEAIPQAGPGGVTFRYSLLNALPSMVQGQWGYVDDGGETISIYAWPKDVASLASGIRVASRTNCLYFNNCSNILVQNLRFEMVAGNNTHEGIPVRFSGGSDNTVTEVVCEYFSNEGRGYGGVHAVSSTNPRVSYSEMRKGQSSFGTFCGQGSGGRWTNLLIEDCSQTPVRVFGHERPAVVDIRPIRCGAGAHANLINMYRGCSDGVVIGYNPPTDLQDRPVKGYATLNESSHLMFLHCVFPIAPDGRGFDDQSNSTAPPFAPSENYVINSFLPPYPDRAALGTSANFGNVHHVVNWNLLNCVLPSAGEKAGSISTLVRKNNLLTNQDAADPTEERVQSVRQFFDAASGDFGTFPDSEVSDASGMDVSSVIADFVALHPDLQDRFYRDINLNPWNPASPGVGPYAAWPQATSPGDPTLSGLNVDNLGVSASVTVTTDQIGDIAWQLLDQDDEPAYSGTYFAETAGVHSFPLSGPYEGDFTFSVTLTNRFGEESNTLSEPVEFGSPYVDVWSLFDGGTWLRKGTSLTDAQDTTRSALIALSIQMTEDQIAAAGANTSVVRTLPSGDGGAGISLAQSASNKQLLFALRGAGGSASLGGSFYLPSAASLEADTKYIYLISATPSGETDTTIRGVLLNAAGEVIATSGPTTATGALKFSGTTTFDIGRMDQNDETDVAASMERFMLWDNATADITDGAVQGLFVDDGALRDPAVAVSAIGPAIVNIFGASLNTGTNAGTGGNFTRS